MRGGSEPIRVLVAGDHPLYLDGMVAALEAAGDMTVVARCADGADALHQIRALGPDVAALDQALPGLDTTGVLGALDGALTRVLVLSADGAGGPMVEAIEAGAAGYVPKRWPRERICAAVRTVATGRSIFAQELHDAMGVEIRRRGSVRRDRFTARELEVLALLAKGRSAPQIAKQLYLSVSTVKTHQHRLYEKLGVADRAAAVAEAMRRGIIR